MVSLMDPTHIFAPKWLTLPENAGGAGPNHNHINGNLHSILTPTAMSGGSDNARNKYQGGSGPVNTNGIAVNNTSRIPLKKSLGREGRGGSVIGGNGTRRDGARIGNVDDRMQRLDRGRLPNNVGDTRGIRLATLSLEDTPEQDATRGHIQRTAFEQNFPSLSHTDRNSVCQQGSPQSSGSISAWGCDSRTRAQKNPSISQSNFTGLPSTSTHSLNHPLPRQNYMNPPAGGSVGIISPERDVTKEFFQSLVPANPNMVMKRLSKGKSDSSTTKPLSSKPTARQPINIPPPSMGWKKAGDETSTNRPSTISRLNSLNNFTGLESHGLRNLQRTPSTIATPATSPYLHDMSCDMQGKSCDNLSISGRVEREGEMEVSRSLEEEERFMYYLGWRDDESGGGFASDITEEEVEEFKRRSLFVNPDQRAELLKRLQRDPRMPVTEEAISTDDSSSDTDTD